jgi:hypothetical protein
MDPGTKVLIFFTGGAAVLASGWWLLRKLFGVPDVDPTAPKASDTRWQSRDEPAEPRDHP